MIVQHRDELAAIITSEHGKTIADAKGEIARGLESVEYACGLTEHLKGGFSSQVAGGVDVHSFRESLGGVAAITPFNFPIMVPLWMTANALATGNVVIVKSSERDPSVSVRLGELLREAGLPAGVFNVLYGNAATVNQLLERPGVDAMSFVGSTPVACHVYSVATEHDKRVQALGGTKNHMVVLADADLDVAADVAINAGYGAAGERCMALSVVVTVGDIADELVAYDDEIFGPVLRVARVATYADAVALINANPYGNATAIFTRDGNAARLFTRQVSLGMIGVNVPIPVPVSSYSFDDWKNSLFDHSHIYGPEGFAFYSRAKVVTTRWPRASESQIDHDFPQTR